VSFGYLLLRTMAVALYAASIYDESRTAKDVLYAVPAHNYQVEVRPFTSVRETAPDIVRVFSLLLRFPLESFQYFCGINSNIEVEKDEIGGAWSTNGGIRCWWESQREGATRKTKT
jgi:hypothetical protein